MKAQASPRSSPCLQTKPQWILQATPQCALVASTTRASFARFRVSGGQAFSGKLPFASASDTPHYCSHQHYCLDAHTRTGNLGLSPATTQLSPSPTQQSLILFSLQFSLFCNLFSAASYCFKKKISFIFPLGPQISWQLASGAHKPFQMHSPSARYFGTDNTLPFSRIAEKYKIRVSVSGKMFIIYSNLFI